MYLDSGLYSLNYLLSGNFKGGLEGGMFYSLSYRTSNVYFEVDSFYRNLISNAVKSKMDVLYVRPLLGQVWAWSSTHTDTVHPHNIQYTDFYQMHKTSKFMLTSEQLAKILHGRIRRYPDTPLFVVLETAGHMASGKGGCANLWREQILGTNNIFMAINAGDLPYRLGFISDVMLKVDGSDIILHKHRRSVIAPWRPITRTDKWRNARYDGLIDLLYSQSFLQDEGTRCVYNDSLYLEETQAQEEQNEILEQIITDIHNKREHKQ